VARAPQPGSAAPAGAGAAAGPAPSASTWKVENGILIGGEGGGRSGGLNSDEQFKDFELELDFMLAEHGTQCSAELVGPEQANASAEKTCLYNSGVSFRTGYQVNIGRREAGEFIGTSSTGRRRARSGATFCARPATRSLEPSEEGGLEPPANRRKGSHMTVSLNGKKISRHHRRPDRSGEAKWKQPGRSTCSGRRLVSLAGLRVRELTEHSHSTALVDVACGSPAAAPFSRPRNFGDRPRGTGTNRYELLVGCIA
jgi:hypothetical protein